MFTGLVADVGEVCDTERDEHGARLTVRSGVAGQLREGDSIAVDGVCLTAVRTSDETFDAEAMNETLRRSTLGTLERGDRVNLELALRASDRIGGHLVQGHVDGVGEVIEAGEEGFARRVVITTSPELLRYVVEKGSVAVAGVSLTVVEVGERSFAVALIPETLERTTLGSAAVGRKLNLEVDMLAKYVEKTVRSG